jgi:hypothetical protein
MTNRLAYTILTSTEAAKRLDALVEKGKDKLERYTNPRHIANPKKVSICVHDTFQTFPELPITPGSLVEIIYYPESCPDHREIVSGIYAHLESPVVFGCSRTRLSLEDI